MTTQTQALTENYWIALHNLRCPVEDAIHDASISFLRSQATYNEDANFRRLCRSALARFDNEQEKLNA